ncbi:GGDEF domain-containing protein [Alkalilimnicola ehrlichii]|uniref:GGDEF domain-containing protein n=1 Tax=Alkalilimnicola ehrlichii TaxID=351052 RepID=UPI003B9E7FE8
MSEQVVSMESRVGKPHTAVPTASSPEGLALRVALRLQSTLEPATVLRYFLQECEPLIGLASVRFQSDALPEVLQAGRARRCRVVQRLRLNGRLLGELTLSRAAPWRPEDREVVDQLVALLVHPLNNAVRFQQAEAASRKDSLTGLQNRRALEEALAREVSLAHRHGHPLSLMVVDLDRFKAINDTYGHRVGDEALCRLAALLQENCRGGDLVFRYGGDEFVVLMAHTVAAGAVRSGQRLLARMARETLAIGESGEKLGLRASAGVAELEPEEGGEGLFYRADMALLRAKRYGRERLVCD